jgi:hypothetical protein
MHNIRKTGDDFCDMLDRGCNQIRHLVRNYHHQRDDEHEKLISTGYG